MSRDDTMRAFRLFGRDETRLVTVDTPEPGPRDALLCVAAVGVCHSDLHVRDSAPASWPLPFTLGHEVCGEIVAVGSEVRDLQTGEQVLVHGPAGCGMCRRCAVGAENLCDRRTEQRAAGVGLGRDGGMSDLLVTEARRLVPIGDLDPVAAAPLTDAALTSLHALRECRSLSESPSAAVVIGVGGLGHVAIQLLRALTDTTVIAIDTRATALALAERCGAHHVLYAGPDAAESVWKVCAGRGADAVLDFVADPQTVRLGASVLAAGSDLVLVGGGNGELVVRKPGPFPPGARLSVPYWGSRSELAEIVELARAERIMTETRVYPLSAANAALADLEHGRVTGRAVLVP